MNKKIDNNILEKHADNIRKSILEMAYLAQSAHTGGSLSCVDLLTVLYFSVLKVYPKSPLDSARDRFIFSKAHDCKALYAVLSEKGFFDKNKLKAYEQNGGISGHSTKGILPGVEITAGSLGHGLPIANGIAYAGKIDNKAHRIFAMLSDGECDEGSTWEAILFAGQHKLDNLIVIVDYNKLQGFGRIDEVMDLEPFANKWKDFGWEVKEVDGHNIEKIHNALRVIPFKKGKPSVLIAHTIKGYGGVQKHIDKVSSQYKPPTEEEYKEAINKLL
jgi:transketolase